METGGTRQGGNFSRKLFPVCLAAVALAGVWMLSRSPGQREEVSEKISAQSEDTGQKTDVAPNVRRDARRFTFVASGNSSTSIAEPAQEPDSLATPGVPENPDDARAWARTNSAAALAWALSATDGAQRDAVTEIVCLQVAETDPARAVALAEQFGAGCTNVLENLVQQWAERDYAAASAHALNKAPGEERNRLLGRVAFMRAQSDPAQAANLVAENISPGEIQTEAAMSVLHQWALRDTRSAAAWAQSFPEGALRARAIQEVENLTTPPENRTTF